MPCAQFLKKNADATEAEVLQARYEAQLQAAESLHHTVDIEIVEDGCTSEEQQDMAALEIRWVYDIHCTSSQPSELCIIPGAGALRPSPKWVIASGTAEEVDQWIDATPHLSYDAHNRHASPK